MSLLEVEGLKVGLRSADGQLPIVHGVETGKDAAASEEEAA